MKSVTEQNDETNLTGDIHIPSSIRLAFSCNTGLLNTQILAENTASIVNVINIK